jgi:proteasome lid subunit RPN8/RPN11
MAAEVAKERRRRVFITTAIVTLYNHCRMPVVGLRSRVLDEMIAHARTAAPAECCGLLLGRGEAVVEAVRARNIADSPARFLMDPRDHFAARRDARARGLEVLGFYHSHPRSPAVPSPTDLAAAAYPDHLYAIVSLVADPADVQLFRLDGGSVLSIRFVTVD